MLAIWTKTPTALMTQLNTSAEGLSQAEALKRVNPPIQGPYVFWQSLQLLFSQFSSPIILILIAAALLSAVIGDASDSIIILLIIIISGLLGFWHEHRASKAMSQLLKVVRIKSTVLRDGISTSVFCEEVVPGDIILLKAGDKIPGDCLIVESKDLFVNESSLTGESFPAEKFAGVSSASAPITARPNFLFLGSHVISGSAKALVASVGVTTHFGQIVQRLGRTPPENEFEAGVKAFGFFLMKMTVSLVVIIFFVNLYFHRTALEAFLFSLALAVGLTPQLLPAIISINLAHGARRMASYKVIVKRLSAIENFGSMDVLCTDKTGTLTDGEVRLSEAIDAKGVPSAQVHLFGFLNATFSSAYDNPIDQALRMAPPLEATLQRLRKLDEIPYDFHRRRLSILLENQSESETYLITKGAVPEVLQICACGVDASGEILSSQDLQTQVSELQRKYGDEGFRTLAVAYKKIVGKKSIGKADEAEMIFLGLLSFSDPPKADSLDILNKLREIGVRVKIITGDSLAVSSHMAKQVGIAQPIILTGALLRGLSKKDLAQQASEVDLFCEIEPGQKEQIVLTLKQAGHVVGYLGDGINDASALHSADVGISVNNAVDVAKETADIVLLEKSLTILVEGIREGRRTFANTMKYIFMATSANVGNMLSMAGSSFFLSFLPLLPKQVLATNLLTDFPEMAIASDRVDEAALLRPARWNLAFIKRFMIVFGLISSFYDFLTFGILIYLDVPIEQFRTAWMTESILSATMIVLIVRTQQPFYKSLPGPFLFGATILITAATLSLPLTPVASSLGLTQLPMTYWPWLTAVLFFYALTAEIAKVFFYGDDGSKNRAKLDGNGQVIF